MFFDNIYPTTVQDIVLLSNAIELWFPNFVAIETHFKLYQTTVNVANREILQFIFDQNMVNP